MADPIRLSALLDDLSGVAAAATGHAPAAVAALLPSLTGPIAEELLKALELDIVSHIVQAWSKAEALKGHAHPKDPTTIARVTLKDHDIKLTLDPELEVTLEGAPVWKLPLTIDVTTTVSAAALTLRAGAIESVEPGRLKFAGKVKWEKESLPLPLKTKELAIPGRLTLSPPIPLTKG
jgi:hypothetical protein